MIGERPLHQFNDLAGDLVRLECVGRGHKESGTNFAKAFAVFRIEIPTAAFGFSAIHEHSRFAAHFPIEELQAQLLVGANPSSELLTAAVEMIVRTNIQGHASAGCRGLQHFFHAVFTGFHHHQTLRHESLDGGGEFSSEAAGIAVVVEETIFNAILAGTQFIREVTHGGQEIDDADAVGKDMCGFSRDFGHPNGILFGIEV